MTMTLVARPYAKRRMAPEVRRQVRQRLQVLGKVSIGVLEEDVRDWSEKPTFKAKVIVARKRWQLTLTYDKRTVGGKRYKWVTEGTGSYNSETGSGKSYIIEPRRQNGILRYELPSLTKTMPASGIPSKSSQAAPGVVYAGAVEHPGIDPRKFEKPLLDHLKSRSPGSFRNELEAAVKVAFRKLGYA